MPCLLLLSVLFFLAFEELQLAHEGFEILEFTINGCVADVCYVVESLELLHDEDADVARGYLAVQGILKLRFDLANESLDLLRCYGTFIAGFHNARKQLGAIKDLSCVILLDNDERDALNDLIGGETVLAGEAFAAAADAGALLRRAGINYSALGIAANRTFHGIILQNS